MSRNKTVRKQSLLDEAVRLKEAISVSKPTSAASEDELLMAVFDAMSESEQASFIQFLDSLEL